MATKRKTGDNPLGPRRVDTESGLESAIAELSTDVGFRSPKQSTTGGSKQVNNAVILEPKRSSQIKARIPHAWWAYLFVEDGQIKATFTEGFLADLNENFNGEVFLVFDDEADRTRDVAVGDIFYVKVVYDSDGFVLTATFEKITSPEDTTTIRHIKIVEFLAGERDGTIKAKYYRFDSIEWVAPKATPIAYTIFFADGSELTITDAEALDGYNPAIQQNWSLEFPVSGTGDFTGEFVGIDDEERFPETGGNQTSYRLRVIGGGFVDPDTMELVPGKRVSTGGLYQESRMCIGGEPFTQLIKVG